MNNRHSIFFTAENVFICLVIIILFAAWEGYVKTKKERDDIIAKYNAQPRVKPYRIKKRSMFSRLTSKSASKKKESEKI